MTEKKKYFLCSTTCCYGCPYCFCQDELFDIYKCKATGKTIKNIYTIPDWCPLPDKPNNNKQPELTDLLIKILDFLYDLKGEWDWKKNEPRANNQKEYEDLCKTIQETECFLRQIQS